MLRLVTCALAVLVLAGGAFSAELAEIDTSGAVRTAEEAAQKTGARMTDAAVQYTGFGIAEVGGTALSSSVLQVTVPDSTIPFMTGPDGMIEAWEVRFDSVSYLEKGECAKKRVATVLLDSAGNLIQVHITPESPPDSEWVPSGSYFESLLSRGFRYVGRCIEPPRSPLSEAIHRFRLCGGCKASETFVWCLMLEDARAESDTPQAYWCVVNREVPGYRSSNMPGPGETPRSRGPFLTNYLCVYYADSGDLAILSTAHNQPLQPREK